MISTFFLKKKEIDKQPGRLSMLFVLLLAESGPAPWVSNLHNKISTDLLHK